MSNVTDPAVETKLADIRSRVTAVDHDSFKGRGGCRAFALALMEAVSAEDLDFLMGHDPVLRNLTCLIQQVATQRSVVDVIGSLFDVAGSPRRRR